ncbi:HAD family hydrolase [Agrococcus sp. KRD186]|uniref:HAD family hydrolase n=1 Tax=Agrococcus sp. KRD186 TaxID=2729730 RepID=UPI0019D28B48
MRAVVFDIDDTLMPEREYVRSGYEHVSNWLAPRISLKANQLQGELWAIFDSEHRGRAYNRLLEIHGIDDALLAQECVQIYREHAPDVKLAESVQDVLAWCRSQGPVGVVSDGPLGMQSAKARALGLAEQGLHVVLSDELGGRAAWKPSPAGMLEVCRRMRILPRDAVYVGDNPAKDFLAAHLAGMAAIRFRTAGQLHASSEPEPGAEADIEIRELSQLRSVLEYV